MKYAVSTWRGGMGCVGLVVALGACQRSAPVVSEGAARAQAVTPAEGPARGEPARAPRVLAPVEELAPTRVPGAARVVAIGDVHGDFAVTRAVMQLAGATGPDDHWVGGPLVVVQVGDQLDRGDGERRILDWFEVLTREARAAGGAFYVLNGNHEVMNAAGDFRYVTPGGYRDFAETEVPVRWRDLLARAPERVRGRMAAMAPGGEYARKMAAHNTVMVVGDTVYAHGGLLPSHVDYGLERINRAVREYLLGNPPGELPAILQGEDSPFWHRVFAVDDSEAVCALLGQTLARVGARRLVIGHTVQPNGINDACGGRVFRVDVGLSSHYGGPVQVLEMRAGQPPRVLSGQRAVGGA
ncbi:MAG: metallophosphoesterase [Deltaproteobacteria bacterium]|nr:metallophosphoesterase [Deltaproteobacteria bacterium]